MSRRASGWIKRSLDRCRDGFRGRLAWEFWPVWVFYLPLLPAATVCLLRSGHPLSFRRVNPSIPCGGLFGESKWQIMGLFPSGLFPSTILLPGGVRDEAAVRGAMTAAEIPFPVVAKPDVGERGFLVRRCPDESALMAHLAAHPNTDFLIQDWVELPLELSVLWYRLPGAGQGRISSLCAKGFLRVIGDGERPVEALLGLTLRGRRQVDRLALHDPALLARVPALQEELVVEPIGNHCRGTEFRDWNDRITPGLTKTFNDIMSAVPGLCFGRFDLRCRSLASLERGQEFKFLEFNGVSAEPAHIYQPGRSLGRAWRDVLAHWGVMVQIARLQARRGIAPGSWSEVRACYQRWRSSR